MQLLAETGLIGFALVAAMLVAAALALARGWRGATADERRAASALAAGSAVMLTQSAVDWLWLIPGLIGLALLSLGLAVAIVARPREATELRARATPPVRAVPVLAALLVASLVLSDLYVRTARAEPGATSAHRSALARTAGRLDPFSVTPRYLEAGALEEQGHRAAARAKLLAALELEPRSFVTLGLLGDLETRAGHPAAAKAYYRRALARNPRDTGLQQLAR
jgi:O-antigen ligase